MYSPGRGAEGEGWGGHGAAGQGSQEWQLGRLGRAEQGKESGGASPPTEVLKQSACGGLYE
jgi:hypothetical protein